MAKPCQAITYKRIKKKTVSGSEASSRNADICNTKCTGSFKQSSVIAITKQTAFPKSMRKFMFGGIQLQHSAPCQITVSFRV